MLLSVMNTLVIFFEVMDKELSLVQIWPVSLVWELEVSSLLNTNIG
jgi:hypothetical protein